MSMVVEIFVLNMMQLPDTAPSFLNLDCPQSLGSMSLSSGGPLSELSMSVFSSSCRHCREISSSESNGGKSICCWAKYGITLKAATGRSNTDPLSSANMYAPPRFFDMTISSPRYRGCIFRLSAFSIAVFLTRTRSPSLKSNCLMVCVCSFSNHTAACTLAW